MAGRCDCSKILPLPVGGFDGLGINRYEKTSLRDKYGIASLVGKGEEYSIRHSPRIHLNRPQQLLESALEPHLTLVQAREQTEGFLKIPQTTRQYNRTATRVTSLEPYKIAAVLSPRYKFQQNIVPANPVYVTPTAKEFKSQALPQQPKSAQLKRQSYVSRKKLLSTNCETPTQSSLPRHNQYQLYHRRSETDKPAQLRQLSERSTPVGTPRSKLQTHRPQNLEENFSVTEEGSLINAILPEDLEILGKLNPKFTISTHDYPQEDSMLSGFSQVLQRTPLQRSQILMMKKRSEI